MYSVETLEDMKELIDLEEDLIRFDTKGNKGTNTIMEIVRVLDKANYVVLLNGNGLIGVRRE